MPSEDLKVLQNIVCWAVLLSGAVIEVKSRLGSLLVAGYGSTSSLSAADYDMFVPVPSRRIFSNLLHTIIMDVVLVTLSSL